MMGKMRKKWVWLIPLIIAIILWEVIAIIINDPSLLPRFSMVIISFYELAIKGYLHPDISMSLYHFGIGLLAAFCVGVPLGILMGWFKKIFILLDPVVELIRPIPPLAWIPLIIAWIGLTHHAAGFIIFIGALFPIMISTYTGIKDTPKVLIDTGKVLGCTTDLKMIRYIALPYSLPSIATGTKMGMGVGWMCVVAAEMFGVSESGLGYRLFSEFYQWNQLDYVIAYMLLIGIIALILDRLFRYFVEDKLFKWKKGIVK
ncbi:MAG: ABC transporter permease [Candidatus Methanoliparum thermophilum]|uniref:ABC transporter permease n=2 Tax=Candidatus Methanoliparum TaxID=2545692 RepID=A0A520KR92_METT2|nr:MAG: ABC transporter permease [Candidatus Methanoliparum thermophilum]BDC35639.1 ABC transporter permease [Candidatus Methanoliparum sp. LAM-1]